MSAWAFRSILFLGAILLLSGFAAASPEIWLAPEDSIRRAQRGDPWKGDYMDLFPPNAPWQQAAAHVQVFEIYPQFLARSSDEELGKVIEGLKRRHIALAVSYGMLHRPKGAEMHEGYGAELAERDIAKLQRLGADVRYVVADEPLLFGHFFWGAGAPPLPIPDLAADFASTARLFRAAFPQVRIGMDDPVMLYDTSQWAPAMREFLEAYRQAFGERMAFVRLECASFQVREWLPRYIEAAEVLRAAGVEFGTLVTGDAADTSDARWLTKAEERYVTWESDDRKAPAQVVFQSWMPRPSKILPENDKDTLTHLVDSYFRDRTKLSGSRVANGLRAHLEDASGLALASRAVTLSILPGFDDPAMTHRSIAGVVPAKARFTQIGLRIGIEGSRTGMARLALGPTRYAEDAGESAVFEFPPGLKGWGKRGEASVEWKPGNTDASLEITASPGQTLLLNSKLIPATPNLKFTFYFDVNVRSGTETGYLIVFFFDASKKVISHLTESLVPENPRLVQSEKTDDRGDIAFSLSQECQSARELRLTFAGDERLRPAFSRIAGVP